MSPKYLQYCYNSLSLVIIGFVVLVIQIIDGGAGSIWGINFKQITFEDITFYTIIVSLSLMIQIFLLFIMSRMVFKIRKTSSRSAQIFPYLYMVSQIIVALLIAFLLLQQLLTDTYRILLSELIVGLSFMVSAAIMGSLAYTCFKSFRSTKSKMTGVYTFAIIALSVQLISAFAYVEVGLSKRPEYISSERNPWSSFFVTPLLDNLLSIYNAVKLTSFLAIWVASILLTRTYAQKTTKVKYWTIVSLPLIYLTFQYCLVFLNQTGALSSLMISPKSPFPYFYNFVVSTVNVGSGLTIGITFFILSRSLVYEHLKYFVIMCGTGIMIIYSSSVSQVLILATFPAWSIVSTTFILPAAFLMLIGLGSATLHISSDIELRRYLHKFRSQFELFTALSSEEGTAAVERKIHNISRKIYDNLENETLFVGKPDPSEIKEYVSGILAEIKKTGKISGQP
jgi:hypothetical protein